MKPEKKDEKEPVNKEKEHSKKKLPYKKPGLKKLGSIKELTNETTGSVFDGDAERLG